MSDKHHLKEAKEFYQKALDEFKMAKEEKNGKLLRDACGKGWLSTIEATYALFVKKGKSAIRSLGKSAGYYSFVIRKRGIFYGHFGRTQS